jgi:1-deoxy-D-xylulose-5-phosphate synthase
MVRDMQDPVLLHVVTHKGHGFKPAEEDPVFFHTPPAFRQENGKAVPQPSSGSPAYTNVARDAIVQQMQLNPRVTVLTAAMCQGNKLEPVRDQFPDRFFDVGICESHAVAFAAGQAKAGLRPIVDIYSTFLQRSYDQIFQEAALQNLPVVFMMDRAGLAGADGPTHHGAFDIGYLRILPNLIVMAPGDAFDLPRMLQLALAQEGPCAIRYPKASAALLPGDRQDVELGKAEIHFWGQDGMLVCYGALLDACVAARDKLAREGIDVGVINARFAKPLDRDVILRALQECSFVVTVEEGALAGGFGSAVLELACSEGVSAAHLRRLGIPDQFVEHAERAELLSDLGIDSEGIVRCCRQLAQQLQV